MRIGPTNQQKVVHHDQFTKAMSFFMNISALINDGALMIKDEGRSFTLP